MGLFSKFAKLAPLEGMPTRVKIPKLGIELDVGPDEEIRAIAEQYMRDMGLPYEPIRKYAKVDVPRAKRIANAFDEMRHDPQDPEVMRQYSALANETMAQYEALKKYGSLKPEFIEGNVDPYDASPRLATEDITKNKHMSVFNTEDGYGQTGITPEMLEENPMLALTGEKFGDRPARVNDIFRVVHDVFGHAKEGVGFRADGEENAWRGHGSMYSPDAVGAATSETRGQNSWLNYGPYGERNRTASTPDTVFAEQKIGLLPKWAWTQGLKDKDLALLLAALIGGGGAGAGLLGRVQTREMA
jgi:hypothetical protein